MDSLDNLKKIIDHIFTSQLQRTIQQEYSDFAEKQRFFKEDCLQRKVLFEKTIPMVCPRTGQINLRYNPEHVAEDYFIPVR